MERQEESFGIYHVSRVYELSKDIGMVFIMPCNRFRIL